MWIISRIANKEKIHVQISSPEPSKARVEEIVLKNFGGSISDYDLYRGTKEEERRVRHGDRYTLTWVSGAKGFTVASLNFSVQDNMYKLFVDTPESNNKLLANGSTTYTLRFRMMEADGVTLSDVRGKKVVPINTPTGKTFVLVDFLNGLATVNFKTNIGGNWIFPGYTGIFEDYKLSSVVQIKAISTDII